ncbi:EH domain-binding protein 1 [Fukomys damarensis]|uniref:EH domain-binding protein 1 n=1 Tax=Fukomys damarensis TaxID=885580 RepID=A0A091CUI6_FUKDA|nr:EH domain-binding protein 1 [Fukomys damarensis]
MNQLSLLEKEHDLGGWYELLGNCGQGEPLKTDGRRRPRSDRREQLLLDKLVALVDMRDALVRDLDEQEKQAEEEDEHLERALEQNEGKMAKRKDKCVLQ